MASNIDVTKPVVGNATTQSIRDNFSAAKTEIEALQTTIGGIPRGYTGSQGDTGFAGSASTVVGYTGSKGTDGTIGVDGAVGFTGSAGANGATGFTGSASTVIGYTGSAGEVGYTGSAGEVGVSTTITTPVLVGAKMTKIAVPSNNIDCSTGDYFTKTILGATTLTVSNMAASGIVSSFVLDLTNGGSSTITWWSGVKWPGGSSPILTAAGRDCLCFYTYDGGTTWSGLVLGKDIK